ncbi:DUF1080 domain-containing protein [Seonamhaeicola sediminis]|uniref:DUF1080 domain-containing protein n=1 Tax=Seonamhaeicola sediminis TaxID=2528206 RepID=A0A562YHM7_9FLAO|nr:DUF1080 domain-containing protein [Seonamhaeicola sediminis]TWO34533.1 DUF1080 domain-containing protein [Seonamhaeicola sediminis]
MKNIHMCFALMVLSVLNIFSCRNENNNKNENAYHSIFNGKNLEGWEGDSTYWRVENGLLVGEVTPETLLKRNSFIIYKKEQPENFELKLEYRISELGNSGVNYRSEIIDEMPFALKGYQCDIDGRNRYTGQNYEERKRTTLAYMGEKVNIPLMPDSIPITNIRKNVLKNCWQIRVVLDTLGTKSQLKSNIKSNDWNKVYIKVNGNKLQHYINGVLMSEVTDLDTVNRTLKGYIGVQVHVGPPMKVEYQNIQLKSLSN